jgi:Putative transmembrane protein (Alph_Pro_TM)
MKLFNKIGLVCLLITLTGLIFLPSVAFAQATTTSKVAPGEFLPVSVKLSNFGGSQRVDVLVKYSILASTGNEIYSTSDTVAVETTASFIKSIQVPSDTPSGTYTAKTVVNYKGQVTPATTQFPFTVERKILGVFQSNFWLYGSIAVVVSILLVLLGHALIKRRVTRFTPFDYSNIPHNERTFYEILSDTIMQMRSRVGDDALLIAANIEGLKINEKGRVLAMVGSPAKIIATLVSEYEKQLGKKVSFSFRK